MSYIPNTPEDQEAMLGPSGITFIGGVTYACSRECAPATPA